MFSITRKNAKDALDKEPLCNSTNVHKIAHAAAIELINCITFILSSIRI